MSESSRFASPTSGFEPDELLARLRKVFLASLGLAVLLHLVIVAIDPFREQAAKAPKPLTTKFIKREPRLTKPLELRKLPQPKRQMVKREVKLAAARMDQVQATAAFNTGAVLGQVANPSVNFTRSSAVSMLNLEPRTFAPGSLTGTRAPENRIDMALEMLDVTTMDTGRYRAMVIQDPNDRQAISGFVKMAQVMSSRSVAAGQVGWGSIRVLDIDILRDMLNEYTGIKAEFLGTIMYDDERIMEVPILIPLGTPNESELEALCRYMLAGGFLFGGTWGEALEKYGGLVSGRDFWSERLPNDHPVFSAFFDLRGGVPAGYSPSLGSGKQGVHSWNVMHGYYIKGRLAGVASRQGWGWRNHIASGDATRQLQMAVNIIVYALTQEGGMTQRLMQMVN